MTRIFRTALVVLVVVGLASCSLFGRDQYKLDEVDAQVDTINLPQAGQVVAEYSFAGGTSSAIYRYQIALRGPDVIDRVDELLLDAGFELQPSTAFGITYLLRTEAREFTAT
jgi:hypothetical protein